MGEKKHHTAINIRDICEICGQYKFRIARRRSHGVSVHSENSVRDKTPREKRQTAKSRTAQRPSSSRISRKPSRSDKICVNPQSDVLGKA